MLRVLKTLIVIVLGILAGFFLIFLISLYFAFQEITEKSETLLQLEQKVNEISETLPQQPKDIPEPKPVELPVVERIIEENEELLLELKQEVRENNEEMLRQNEEIIRQNEEIIRQNEEILRQIEQEAKDKEELLLCILQGIYEYERHYIRCDVL